MAKNGLKIGSTLHYNLFQITYRQFYMILNKTQYISLLRSMLNKTKDLKLLGPF